MGKQILNRREKIYTSDIPPEIPDVSGFIEDDDYATSSKGGTIKVDGTYAIELTSGGKLKAKEIAAESYAEANDAAFVSKATLDNVIAALPQPSAGVEFTEILNGSYSTGNPDFTYPEGKSFSDYSGMIVVANLSGDDFDTLVLPRAVFSIATYFVQVKLGVFFNDNADRGLKIQLKKDGSGVQSITSTGSVKLARVYVF